MQSSIQPPQILTAIQAKLFVQALNGVCDIPKSQFSQAIIKGDSLTIPEEEYKTGL